MMLHKMMRSVATKSNERQMKIAPPTFRPTANVQTFRQHPFYKFRAWTQDVCARKNGFVKIKWNFLSNEIFIVHTNRNKKS